MIAGVMFAGCKMEDNKMKPAEPTIKVGGIYASQNENGSWRLTRVLALDEHAVHLRSYTNEFTEQPKDVELSQLKWFIGHMPLAREGFESEKHVLIKVVPVADNELEGYRIYLEAMKNGPRSH